ncbi:hypothetical protein BVG16_25890 [Paenibacillus selenitireducens]|uniref:Uncharacterized protein n=1 Tax=Paenibacillus selenitireducens TaxID=1324314 RepID=A0A1T2X2C9_9BACL|nr:hypothetical protein [Paenibacillus selenitireducens]OPA73876.1 hypothetical protein BVG16_25890 [Paenibacillus selenitireducens]
MMTEQPDQDITAKNFAKGIALAFKDSSIFRDVSKEKDDAPPIGMKQVFNHLTGKETLTPEQQEQFKQESLSRRFLNNM